MAYHLTHTLYFNSKQVENVVIELYRKDVIPDAVTALKCTSFETQYLSGDGDKTDGIIPLEATFGIWLPFNSPLDYRYFIFTDPDEWQMIAYSDAQIIFSGYLNPSDGNSDFKDLPYDITLSATDGLGLLKQEPLAEYATKTYTGTETLLTYLLDCFSKTGLDLPIDIRCNIYEVSMNNRNTDMAADMFGQAKLHYRSFMKAATTFDNCYDVLDRMLKEHFTLYQWMGTWVVLRFAEMQDRVGGSKYYTHYVDNYPAGVEEMNTYAPIGRNIKLHPINSSVKISCQFPIKLAKHEFPYNVWPELPTNNKFERGIFSLPLSGPDYVSYIVSDWLVREITLFPYTMAPNPGITIYRKSTLNTFSIETNRELVIISPAFIIAAFVPEPIPVSSGDKIRAGVTLRTSIAETNQTKIGLMIYLVPDDGSPNYNWFVSDEDGKNEWQQSPGTPRFMEIRYDSPSLTTSDNSVNAESPPFPKSGQLYVVFEALSNVSGQIHYFTNFDFEYIPFTAGGYIPVLADYWLTSQSANYKDVVEEEVGMSDSLIKVTKGTLYRYDGLSLTTPTWYRFGVVEQRHYKELLNLGVYNHKYRRQNKIYGTFGGTKYSPVSDPTLSFPIGFHQHFKFIDAPELQDTLFMPVPPLRIDWFNGQVDATFMECLNSAEFVNGGIPLPLDIINSLINKINTTTIAEWQASPGAPPEGTPYFPPHANLLPDTTDTIRVETTPTASPFAAADANGAGNSPSITLTFDGFPVGGKKVVYWTIGPDIAIGNRFIISLYGIQVVYTVTSGIIFNDGNQTGDVHEFKYKFK